MTPPHEDSSPNNKGTPRAKQHWWHPNSKHITIVIGIAAIVTAIIIGVAQIMAMYDIHDKEQSSKHSSAPAAPSTTTPTEETSSPAGPSPSVASEENAPQSPEFGCYNGDDPTLCTSAHTKEIYPSTNGTCDDASLILHLGGIPGTDLLSTGLSIEPVPGAERLCSVTREEGLPASPLAGLWKSDANNDGYAEGGELRRCHNHQGLPASCEGPHFSEVIYEGNHETDCRTHYQSFADRSANTDKNLKISGFSEGDTFICRVEVQTTGESLLHSVRGLGDRRPLIQ